MIKAYYNRLNAASMVDNEIIQWVSEMDGMVQACAEKAYNLPSLDDGSPHQRIWRESAQKAAGKGTAERFVYTHYGYAVEDMACSEIKVKYPFGRKGSLIVQFQVTHGDTRPDIVISENGKGERAWLDITSEANAGHISAKCGSGWKTRDYVAELLYPPLDLTKIRISAEPGIGQYAEGLAASRALALRERKRNEYMVSTLRRVLAICAKKPPGSKQEVAQLIENWFGIPFMGRTKHPAIKSLLREYREKAPSDGYSYIAQWILTRYYREDSQDRSQAMAFVDRSMEQKMRQENLFG